MKTFLSVLFIAAAFSSSSFAMSGTLEVSSGSLRVKREDGMKVHFYPGKYKAELDFKRGLVNLMVERKEIRTDAVMQIPSGTSIPENGQVNIDGFRTGQTFAIAGSISTQRANSPSVSENEGCVYYREEWVCRWHGGYKDCGWETVPAQGWRRVEFYYQTTTKTYALQLDSRTGVPARFNGRSVDRNKIYTYQGQCY